MPGSSRNVSSLMTITDHPERTAIVFGADRMTYAQLDAESNQVANLLVERRIRPGDKVALSCPNIGQFTTIYFRILAAGADGFNRRRCSTAKIGHGLAWHR